MTRPPTPLAMLLQALRRPMEEALVGLSAGPEALLDPASREQAQAVAQEASLLASRLSGLLQAAQPPRQAPLVVAVDDEHGALLALRELLSPEFELLICTDPHEALRLIRELRPDAVLSDLRMPEMSGYALVEALKGDSTTADIPCLMMSAAGEVEAKVKALEMGGSDFLAKPLHPDELAARLRKAIEHAQELARQRALKETDELTGLPNRRAMRRFVESTLQGVRAAGQPLTVAMIDQNRLKLVNDRYGHRAGDDAIRAVAHALAKRKRKTDLAARIGGDEFALVMVGARREEAQRLLSQIDAELGQRPFHLPEPSLRASFSFGVAELGERGRDESFESLLERADADLYQAKHQLRHAG